MANKLIEDLGASGALAASTLLETQVPATTPTQKSTLTQLVDFLSPRGSGSPEGVITRPPGCWYVDTDVPERVFYKKSGTGNVGWLQIVQL